MSEPEWFKSSYSSNGGNCVEVAANLATSAGIVPIRDSKDPEGPSLVFPAAEFSSFLSAVRNGEFGAV
ncbi:DUF397 domain-containing protein [Kitasatospora sp. NPDC089913]|uniref:DUF397 domain-containing protein n=1 Tax=Streptomycetaceae TaxID=2062 RepID=UPI00087A657C|nr:DUF397 domain-containing protein [Streptomyces sp. TLI_053]SDT83132.1 protein of unknown function [Streptomyces sp. TLI_053]